MTRSGTGSEDRWQIAQTTGTAATHVRRVKKFQVAVAAFSSWASECSTSESAGAYRIVLIHSIALLGLRTTLQSL